ETPYIVMPYVEGEDLRALIETDELSLLEKVEIMTRVAEGLQYAHQNSVFHLDLKPANIRVEPNRSVQITDFGIARLIPQSSRREFVGTLRYMAPELIQGYLGDWSADIFSFGVIFYELVSGRHPFEAPDAASLLDKLTQGQPAPLRELAPECPRDLEQ